MNYDWDFRVFAPYTFGFLHALWIVVELSFLSAFIGTILAIPLAAMLKKRSMAWVLLPINDFIRAIPILVLMFFFYLFPYKETFGMTPISEFSAAAIAMIVSWAAFVADLIRAAVDGVSQNPIRGARALGMKEPEIWRYIAIPDIIRQILPSFIGFFIANTKSTSLASAIGVQELVFTARVATGQTARNLEAWIIVAVAYIVLIVPLGCAARVVEKGEWLKRR